MRVVTWNLWWRFGPWEARQRAIEATLAGLDPDVVCLQETWVDDQGRSQAAGLATALGLHATTVETATSDGFGVTNAVLSRWPIAEAERAALPGPDGEPSRRHAVVAALDAPFGRVVAASTHLHHLLTASATRVLQSRALLDLIARHRGDPTTDFPVVVGGDLNAVPWSDEIRLLTGASPSPDPDLVFTDCWEHAGDGGTGHTWAATNPYLAESAIPNRRIDYLLISWPRPRPLGNPRRTWVAGVEPLGGVQPSDHYAVVADLVAPS
jgi:endonuclease/exonuclease/phosphatase family metal-dependent hydrolase